MTKDEYLSYLRSPAWKARRAETLKRAGYRCEDCVQRYQMAGGLSSGVIVGRATQAHHLTYERVGEEAPTDLVALCEKCHRARHDIESASEKWDRRMRDAWR